MAIETTTLEDHPELLDPMNEIGGAAWPTFMLNDPVLALNTVLDDQRNLAFVTFGDILESHLAAVAFARARAIFLLGVVEAFCVGIVMTSLVGPFMVVRNWSRDVEELTMDMLRQTMEPMLGSLPHIIGIEPFHVFPSALLLMTFLSFFIGIFLQLMWEELPITEPL